MGHLDAEKKSARDRALRYILVDACNASTRMPLRSLASTRSACRATSLWDYAIDYFSVDFLNKLAFLSIFEFKKKENIPPKNVYVF